MLNAIISTSTKILQSETKFYKPRGYCNSAVSFSIANTSFLFAMLIYICCTKHCLEYLTIVSKMWSIPMVYILQDWSALSEDKCRDG